MKIKRIICALLVVFSLAAAFPMAAFAETTTVSAPALAATAPKSTIARGETSVLKIYYVGTGKRYTGSAKWSSSNKAVLTVGSTGKITARKVGTAVVSAKLPNGQTLKWIVSVKPKASVGVSSASPSAIKIKFLNYSKKSISRIAYDVYQYNSAGSYLGKVSITTSFPSALPHNYYQTVTLGKYLDGDQIIANSTYKAKVVITRVYFSNGTSCKP